MIYCGFLTNQGFLILKNVSMVNKASRVTSQKYICPVPQDGNVLT